MLLRCGRWRLDRFSAGANPCRETRVASGEIGLPDVSAGLGQPHVGEDPTDELMRHLRGVDGAVVKGGHDGKDGGSGVGGQAHVADVDAVKGRLPQAEDERAAFLERDVRGPLDQVGGEAVGDTGERPHAAGDDDHPGGGIAAAGHRRSNVVFRMLDDLIGCAAEQLFRQLVASGDAQFLGQDAQRVVGRDEVDAAHARVGIEQLEQGAAKDGPAGSGEGDGKVLQRLRVRVHGFQPTGSGARGTERPHPRNAASRQQERGLTFREPRHSRQANADWMSDLACSQQSISRQRFRSTHLPADGQRRLFLAIRIQRGLDFDENLGLGEKWKF